jgi:hypothetical protein
MQRAEQEALDADREAERQAEEEERLSVLLTRDICWKIKAAMRAYKQDNFERGQ